MNQEKNPKSHRQMSGIVVSNKRIKTVAVQVNRLIRHPRYGKTITVSSKIHAHNELDGIEKGDFVTIEETRPYSKTKSWKVIKIDRKAEAPTEEIDDGIAEVEPKANPEENVEMKIE